jgi:Protein of unknown function (DUF551)
MTDWHLIEDGNQPDGIVLTLWDGTNSLTGAPARHYMVAEYDAERGDWLTEDGDVIDEPTHWTELPEPPSR